MAQIITSPLASQEMANNLIDPVRQSLENLANMQLQNIEKQKQRFNVFAGLSTMMPPEQAQAMSFLPPEMLSKIIPQMQKQQQAQQNLKNYMQGQQGQQYMGGQGQFGVGQPGGSELDRESQAGQQAFMEAYQLSNGNVAIAKRAEQDAMKRMQQERLQKEKMEKSTKEFAYKETRSYRDDLEKKYRNAKSDLQGLDVQYELVNTGKLHGPKKKLLLDIVGNYMNLDELGKSALMNTESQVFEKMSIPYFRDLKTKFGARPTQFEAKQLQKSFPTLYQNDDGKKIIIDFMRHDRRTNIKERELANKIVKQNGGTPPLDLSSKTLEKLDEWEAKAYKTFKSRISQTLAKKGAPKLPASQVGKGKIYKNKSNNIYYISNGKSWELLMSDSKV